MERREPTLTGANDNERDDSSNRRPAPVYDEPRSSRSSYAAPMPPQSNSILPVAALVIALIGVGGAGYLGWQLTQTHAALLSTSARVTQLESQLNITSTESTASLGSLQVNIRSVDSEVKKLWDLARKNNAEANEKINGANKAIDSSKKAIADVKSDADSIKQEVLSHKAGIEEAGSRLEAQEKTIAEQRKRLQDVAANLTALLGQIKNAEALASRMNTAEEAIDAIDDNRKIINRDLVQIKQQLGIKSQ